MTWLLLDADMLLYQTVAACEVEIEWCPNIITTHLPVKEAQLMFNDLLDLKRKQAQSDRFTLCWTADQNFRKDIEASYKGNRAGNHRRKPVGYLAIRRWAEQQFPSECWHRLEADDVLGILTTRHQDQVVMWSGDKDLKQIPGLHLDDEGKIYVPGATIVDSPLYVKGYTFIKCKKKHFQYETVVMLDSGGNKIKEIDTYKALIESDLTGVFINYEKNFFAIETCDPMHLNDVRVLSQKMAHKFPRFEPGDLLLSFRSINSIGVLDPDTSLFKWFYVGAVQYQHSPRFYGDNQILVFDNLGGSSKDNPSRVAAIDISSGHAQTVFPRKNIKIPPRYFFSETSGHIDLHADQKRMLVSWTHQGLVWEIDIESGEVLWEYINTHPVENRFGRLPVYTAIYVNKLDFPLNRGELP